MRARFASAVLRAQEELGGDLAVRQAGGGKRCHPLLGRRELIGRYMTQTDTLEFSPRSLGPEPGACVLEELERPAASPA